MRTIGLRIGIYILSIIVGVWISIPIANDLYKDHVERVERLEKVLASGSKFLALLSRLAKPEAKPYLFYITLVFWLEIINLAAKWLFSPFIPDALEVVEEVGEFFIGDIFPSIPSIVVGVLMVLFGAISLNFFLGVMMARASIALVIKSLTYS